MLDDNNYVGSANDKLMLLDDCICVGQEITYECTVCGEGATVWTGSLRLFRCTGSDIILRHRNFLEMAMGACLDGPINISARSISQREFDANTNLTCYTSQLTLQNIITNVNNNTVMCIHLINETSQRIVGRTSVRLTKGKILIKAFHANMHY